MKKILLFQRQVLEFACDACVPLPLTKEALAEKFPAEVDWLWPKVGQELATVLQYTRTDACASDRILKAFDNDVAFDTHGDDASFTFKYCTALTADDRQAVAPLMKAFYDPLLLESGFPSTVHGQPGRFSRDTVVKAFWNENQDLGVCPGCDHERPDVVRGKVACDADHFLPKALYPFLSVHRSNLTPLCKECNQVVKGKEDPIDAQKKEPLARTFLPYTSPAVSCLDINVYRDDKNALHVSLADVERPASPRVTNLNRVFHLEDRWTQRLDRVEERVLDDLMGVAHIFGTGEDADRVGQVRSVMHSQSLRKSKKIGRQPGYILESSYLRYALADDSEFDLLLKYFSVQEGADLG